MIIKKTQLKKEKLAVKVGKYLAKKYFDIELSYHQALFFNVGINRTRNFMLGITSSRYGKSMICAMIALYRACLFGEDVGVISINDKKTKIIFEHCIKLFPRMPDDIKELIIGESKIENLQVKASKDGFHFKNGGKIMCISSNESKKNTEMKASDAIGQGFTCTIIDESAMISDENYSPIARTKIQSKKWIEISNPHQKNHFLDSYNAPEYWVLHIDIDEAIKEGRLTEKDYEIAKKQMTARDIQVYYDCKFVDTSANNVFKNIKDCIDYNLINLSSYNRFCYIGIDLAKSYDFTAISILDEQGNNIYNTRWNKLDYSYQKIMIQEILNKFPYNKIVIDSTANESVVEDLGIKNNVIPFRFTSSSKKELITNAIICFEQKKVKLINEPILIEELNRYEVEITGKGNETYNAPQGLHDDMCVAMMLALYGYIQEKKKFDNTMPISVGIY